VYVRDFDNGMLCKLTLSFTLQFTFFDWRHWKPMTS